jgi:quercetin dioxygenase-like cupin family protein
MALKNINNLIEYSEGGILSKELVRTEKSDITLFCMAKGTIISEHTSTKEGFVYVLEGNGIFNLKGEDITMESGIFIFINKNDVHSVRAKENTSFVLSLVK